jgi:hypothetical protein
MDLMSAYNLLNFAPEDVRYLAAPLTDELTMVSHVGGFGYTNLPPYFDHIPKVLLRLVRQLLRGVADMFVDDKMFFTLLANIEHDQRVVVDMAAGLLGPGAVAHDNTFVGQTQDWIDPDSDHSRALLSQGDAPFRRGRHRGARDHLAAGAAGVARLAIIASVCGAAP